MARARSKARRGRVARLIGSAALVGLAAWTIHQARLPGPWQHVLATREGLIGGATSTGHVIGADSMFVALPHPRALNRLVEVRHAERVVVVPVLDVGPWNEADAYWERGARPAAEQGRGTYRTPTNRAGIDLSDAVFAALGLRDNDDVDWRFVHRGFVPLLR